MYRFALVILPVMACFGALLPGLGQLFAFRLAVLAVTLAATLILSASPVRSKLLTSLFTFALLWVIDAALLLTLVTNFSDALLEALALMIGLVFVFALAAIAAARPSLAILRSLAYGWLLAYLVCAAVAVWELMTSKHLNNYIVQSYYLNPGRYPDIASVMGNPNQYGFFLCASFSFIIYLYVCSTRRATRFLLATIALSSFYFMYAANCRLGIVCLAVQLLMWLRVYRTSMVRLLKIAASLVLVAASSVILLGLAVPQAIFRQGNLIENLIDALNAYNELGSSTYVRLNLFLNGIALMIRSGFLGVGPAGYEAALRAGPNEFPTYGNYSPHSVFAEIGSQYGLIVLILFCLLLTQWYRIGSHAVRMATDNAGRRAGHVVRIGVVSLFFASWLNSGFLKPSLSWMLLASLAVFAVYCEQLSKADQGGQRIQPSGGERTGIRIRQSVGV